MGVFEAVLPFFVIYVFWVAFFAIMSNILGANDSRANGYTDMPLFIGFFLNTFENSIGNINPPSISTLVKKEGKSISVLDRIVIYLIYFYWWLAQIVLLMVLLNFVIALISQYYEDVMNSAEMHTYLQRHQLNHEYYVIQ